MHSRSFLQTVIIHQENSIKTQSSPSAPHLLVQLIMNMMKCPSFDPSDTCSFYFFSVLSSSGRSYLWMFYAKFGYQYSITYWFQINLHKCTNRQRDIMILHCCCLMIKKALSISFKTCLVKR